MDFLCPPSRSVRHEFEKLVNRMNPPRVSIDNVYAEKATLIKVDSANKRGSLLKVVQVLNDLNLIIRRAYISSDGRWFMDVFHVTDECGNKVYEEEIADRIQQSLRPKEEHSFEPMMTRSVSGGAEHTSIELLGRDRPGLVSEVFAVLTDLKCNVVAAEVWTHNLRMASVVYITDEANGLAIDDPDRLSNIKRLLLYVLKGNSRKCPISANTAVSVGSIHTQRRLHQIMYADRDYDDNNIVQDADAAAAADDDSAISQRTKPLVTVEDCVEKGYTVVSVRCPDRPKLLFDTVCTITDMQYVIFHGTIVAEGPEAQQEYYIRHMDGCPISSEAERQRVIHCLEAAIKRRASEGIRVELCSEDRVGLLCDVTRIFRENGLWITGAEVKTRGTQAVHVFYVSDASGRGRGCCAYPVKTQTIEAVRKQIGRLTNILHVHVDHVIKDTTNSNSTTTTSFTTLFRSKSEKFLSNLGIIKPTMLLN